MLTKEELPFCPVQITVDLISNKWQLLIMREFLKDTKRFNEINRSIDGISPKVLAENLKRWNQMVLLFGQFIQKFPLKLNTL